jgi:hypothetical protein
MNRNTQAIVAISLLLPLLPSLGCGDDDSDPGPGIDAGPGVDSGPTVRRDGGPPPPPPPPAEGWPDGNEWSWDGSWTPSDGDFPLDGLFDDEYNDGHIGRYGDPTPILPPGQWDWNDADNDVANWRAFNDSLGHFDRLEDMAGHHYGWRFVANATSMIDYTGGAMYFEGSLGTDIVDLGRDGAIHGFGEGDLRDGPDILVFDRSWSLHFRTGSTSGGSARDDDLVIAGCGENPDGAWDITTTTIHTGPGHDWVFIRDLSRAGVDLGNGDGGRTDTIDPQDGDDLLVLRGNTQDFRMSGGRGDDVAVWYVDDNVQTTAYLGPNFFGCGGHGEAIWGDPGTDRLVLVVPTDTTMVAAPPTPDGGILVMGTDGTLRLDDPTQDDVYARYCIECGTGPGGRKTVIVEYNSADGSVHTGYFTLPAFEELQVGIGDGARVFRTSRPSIRPSRHLISVSENDAPRADGPNGSPLPGRPLSAVVPSWRPSRSRVMITNSCWVVVPARWPSSRSCSPSSWLRPQRGHRRTHWLRRYPRPARPPNVDSISRRPRCPGSALGAGPSSATTWRPEASPWAYSSLISWSPKPPRPAGVGRCSSTGWRVRSSGRDRTAAVR